ncbi:hypothetical protein [Polymorphospora rubra]|uniref:Uncharacterized protein n=1 Tax=Polymorphospora rubra TaxID=338584 RepID=A0A810N344_9ACTN|nr:hypothetical protein [Polymorphospora rubra]BCJ66629.1 hypothetical protein Prubr_36500 [Polymorphospora rubra]
MCEAGKGRFRPPAATRSGTAVTQSATARGRPADPPDTVFAPVGRVPGGRAGRPRVCDISSCTVMQYGQVLARDTAAATVSLVSRSTVLSTITVSRSISQQAASTSGAGAWSATGGANTPKSRSSCR